MNSALRSLGSFLWRDKPNSSLLRQFFMIGLAVGVVVLSVGFMVGLALGGWVIEKGTEGVIWGLLLVSASLFVGIIAAPLMDLVKHRFGSLYHLTLLIFYALGLVVGVYLIAQIVVLAEGRYIFLPWEIIKQRMN